MGNFPEMFIASLLEPEQGHRLTNANALAKCVNVLFLQTATRV